MIPISLLTVFYKPGHYGQWIAAIVVCMCAISAGMSLSWPSAALPKIRGGETDFRLDLSEQGWVVSIIFIGNLLSPIPSGYLLELIGRRNSLCVVIWLQVAAWAVISRCPGFTYLCVARFLSGIWVGNVYTAVPVYIGESAEPRMRGSVGALFGVCLFVGSLLEGTMGPYLEYALLADVSAGFNVFLAAALCLIPETPYYYIAKGDTDSAKGSLSWLRGFADLTVISAIMDSVKKQQNDKTSFIDLFKTPVNRKSFFIVLSQGAIQRLSGLTILFAFTSVLVPDSIIEARKSAIVLNVVWILASTLSSIIMDKFARKFLMTFSCLGSSITLLVFSAWCYMRDKTTIDLSETLWLPLVLLIIHGIFYCLGIVSIPLLLQGEMFPPNIKSKASALTAMVVALFSGISTKIYLPLETTVGTYVNFVICSAASLLGAFISVFVMIETRGRTLEEIQDILAGGKKKEIIESTKF